MGCALQHTLLSSSENWDGHVDRIGAMMKAQKFLADET
jgi:hypothetical protein